MSADPGRADQIARMIAILSLCLSALSFGRGCLHDAQLEATTERVDAMVNQPIIRVLGPAVLDSLEIAIDTAEDGQARVAMLDVRSTLRLVNVGARIAKIFVIAAADTMTGKPALRDIIRDQYLRDMMVRFMRWNEYYSPPSLAPGDTATLSFKHEIRLAGRREATLHYLVMYGNPLKQVYDTYFWMRCSVAAPPLR